MAEFYNIDNQNNQTETMGSNYQNSGGGDYSNNTQSVGSTRTPKTGYSTMSGFIDANRPKNENWLNTSYDTNLKSDIGYQGLGQGYLNQATTQEASNLGKTAGGNQGGSYFGDFKFDDMGNTVSGGEGVNSGNYMQSGMQAYDVWNPELNYDDISSKLSQTPDPYKYDMSSRDTAKNAITGTDWLSKSGMTTTESGKDLTGLYNAMFGDQLVGSKTNKDISNVIGAIDKITGERSDQSTQDLNAINEMYQNNLKSNLGLRGKQTLDITNQQNPFEDEVATQSRLDELSNIDKILGGNLSQQITSDMSPTAKQSYAADKILSDFEKGGTPNMGNLSSLERDFLGFSHGYGTNLSNTTPTGVMYNNREVMAMPSTNGRVELLIGGKMKTVPSNVFKELMIGKIAPEYVLQNY